MVIKYNSVRKFSWDVLKSYSLGIAKMLIILKDAFLGLGMYGPGPALGKMKVGGGKLGQVVEKNGRAVTVKRVQYTMCCCEA